MVGCHRCLTDLGKVSRKIVAVLVDFVQMRGVGLPKFVVTFSQTVYWVNLGMLREGETPAQIFWHIGVKKSGTSFFKLVGGGEGGGSNSKRTAPFL